MGIGSFQATGPGIAATGSGESPEVIEARALGASADVVLHFIQEDGPESGHVRVVLTPETRALTVIEARMAAEQAFLQTLKQPGLGDDLDRITVVVRMMPRSHPDPNEVQQVIVYQHKAGRDWSVLPGD
jgi:hypothetical protein